MNENDLLRLAWNARENAYPWKSGTKVGCAILCNDEIHSTGWNIEGLWQTSIHAEVSAISHISWGNRHIKYIAIVAQTKHFTPCGACMDWIMQFGTKDTMILIQGNDMVVHRYSLEELMPYYPIQ